MKNWLISISHLRNWEEMNADGCEKKSEYGDGCPKAMDGNPPLVNSRTFFGEMMMISRLSHDEVQPGLR